MKKYRFWLGHIGISILAWVTATAIFALLTQTGKEGLDVLTFACLYAGFAASAMQYGGSISGLGLPIQMGATRKQVCRWLLLERLGTAGIITVIFGLGAFLLLKSTAESFGLTLALLGMLLGIDGLCGLFFKWRIQNGVMGVIGLVIMMSFSTAISVLISLSWLWAVALGILGVGAMLMAVGSCMERKTIFSWDVSF